MLTGLFGSLAVSLSCSAECLLLYPTPQPAVMRHAIDGRKILRQCNKSHFNNVHEVLLKDAG